MKSAICLMVRNEVRDIAEWIAFHALIGFDSQIIFDNGSDDGTYEVLCAARELHDIRVHRWPDRGPRTQLAAYEAACAAYKLEFDWIGFIDSDEFLLPVGGEPINALLARFEGWSGLALHWALFGANGHEDFPDGLVTESFTRRADRDFFPARHVKSIIRPGYAVRCLNPHCFELAGAARGSYCDGRGREMRWFPAPECGGVQPGLAADPPEDGLARVNHYFTRSRAHWLAKLRRGYPSDIAVRKLAEFEMYDRNEIEDRGMCRYLPDLRMGVARIGARVEKVKEAVLF